MTGKNDGKPSVPPAGGRARKKVNEIEGVDNKIKFLISEKLNIPLEEVTPERKLRNGLDELDRVELQMELEAIFSIDIPDETFNRMNTVKEIIKYVGREVYDID